MWTADKIYYSGSDNFVRAYQGRILVWDKRLPPNNSIYYTSTDQQIVIPYRPNNFGGANIVSNTYTNGQGVIVFDQDVTTIGYMAFYDLDKLETVILPATITTIGRDSFRMLRDSSSPEDNPLNSVIIPEGVISLERRCFYGVNRLPSITIPSTCTSIGADAFEYCTSLSEVIINATVPPVLGAGDPDQYGEVYHQFDFTTITHITNYGYIKVPPESVNSYKTATGWSKYESRIISQ